jgi:hypothetical protein
MSNTIQQLQAFNNSGGGGQPNNVYKENSGISFHNQNQVHGGNLHSSNNSREMSSNDRIQNVWAYNLEEEMEKIRDVVENYRFISMVSS